jgi:hypothetical protein
MSTTDEPQGLREGPPPGRPGPVKVFPVFPPAEIAAAGRALIESTELGREIAVQKINNWRAAHGAPLNTFKVSLAERAARFGSDNVAQRLKRLAAIEAKLRRFAKKGLSLDEMQDVAGCRAVLQTCDDVAGVVKQFHTRTRSELVREDDYISKPKRDGYRSHHLIFRYRPQTEANRPFDGMKVEIQIRTRLQHAWATAVETVDLFTGQSLKVGGGAKPWKRFFALMAAHMARIETRHPVPDTPQEAEELRRLLGESAKTLDVVNWLQLWSSTVEHLPTSHRGARHYILKTDASEPSVTVFSFRDFRSASEAYADQEKQRVGNPHVQVVQVGAESISATRAAYPAYYADTRYFVETLREAL